MPFQTAKCKACNRDIIWAVTPTGARIPLDARPAVMYQLFEGTGGDGPRAIPIPAGAQMVADTEARLGFDFGDPAGVPAAEPSKTYVSHFLTCPDAGSFGKGRKA